jgi:hypothetical protein
MFRLFLMGEARLLELRAVVDRGSRRPAPDLRETALHFQGIAMLTVY